RSVSGRVLTCDNQTLKIQVQNEDGSYKIQQIDAAAVVDVVPGITTDGLQKAMLDYQQGKFANAQIGFASYLLNRDPAQPRLAWMTQWVGVRLIAAGYLAGQWEQTFNLVSQIDQRPLPPFLLAELPLMWMRAEHPQTAAAARVAAAPWTSKGTPATRLLAASILQHDPADKTGIATLRALAGDTNRPLLARYAQVLIWRNETPPSVLRNWKQWKRKCDALPIAMQQGPLALVADRLQTGGKSVDARPLWLSVEQFATRPDLRFRAATQLKR
ncbi:MAG: hypothetical protein AAFP90_11080, partial [Planctomycetota bacterium]